MITRIYIVSEKKRALEIAAWARIVDGALKMEANNAFLAGEIPSGRVVPIHLESSFHSVLL